MASTLIFLPRGAGLVVFSLWTRQTFAKDFHSRGSKHLLEPTRAGATVPALLQGFLIWVLGGAMFHWVPIALLPSHPPSERQVEPASKMQTLVCCSSVKQASHGLRDKVQTPRTAPTTLPRLASLPIFSISLGYQPHLTASRLKHAVGSLASISAFA